MTFYVRQYFRIKDPNGSRLFGINIEDARRIQIDVYGGRHDHVLRIYAT